MIRAKDAVKAVGQAVIDNKVFLTELDQAIGDGDHERNLYTVSWYSSHCIWRWK